jgi:hypothetical protein
METIEYRTIDKSAWPRGTWDAEPDKVQWPDPETGLPCLLVRAGQQLGHLCGYVGVPPGHPWHGIEADDIDPHPDVHGGLTYSEFCRPATDEGRGVCHLPGPGEPDDVWWLGFDCGHFMDSSPGLPSIPGYPAGGVYRDVAYVRAECARLAGHVLVAGRRPV